MAFFLEQKCQECLKYCVAENLGNHFQKTHTMLKFQGLTLTISAKKKLHESVTSGWLITWLLNSHLDT